MDRLKLVTSAYVLGQDRTHNLFDRLVKFQTNFPEIYQTEEVRNFWLNLLMEVDLGRDPQDNLVLPEGVPGPKDDKPFTVLDYMLAFCLKQFLENPALIQDPTKK